MLFTPHPYQSRAIDFVLAHPYCMLFLDMGLGKSVITLTAFSRLLDDLEVHRALVVAPKSVAEATWTAEVEKWNHLFDLRVSCILGNAQQRTAAIEADADLYVISRDNLQWLVAHHLAAVKKKVDVLILDELTSFKNPKAQRFKAVRALRPFFRRIIGLTGTPAPNGYLDLWAQVFCIDGGQRLGTFITRYRDRYFRIENPYVTWPTYVLAPGAQNTINEKIADITLSMSAADYLTLPDRIPILHTIRLDPATLRAYHRFEQDQVLTIIGVGKETEYNRVRIDFIGRKIDYDTYIAKARALGIAESEIWKLEPQVATPSPASPITVPAASPAGPPQPSTINAQPSTPSSPTAILASNAAALATKLAQFANGAIYDDDHVAHPVHDAKLTALQEIIEAAQSPVLVFYSFKHDADRIREALGRFYNVCVYHDPTDLVLWNARRIRVLLCHPASTAYGLNMQNGGHTIVWYGLTWNLEHYQQANARLHRQGQQQPVRIYHLVAEGTIDERAYAALSRKADMQSALLNTIKCLTEKYSR